LSKLIKCMSCGESFDPKGKMRGGYYNQCNTCSEEDRDTMYLGRPGKTSKGANIEIFRENLEFYKEVLKVEGKRGPTANLIIGNVANEMVRQGEKDQKILMDKRQSKHIHVKKFWDDKK